MSTTTSSTENDQTISNATVTTSKSKAQNWLLIIQVFVAGAASLAVEMCASRLLAPYFGSSLFVWANIIGLILLYLTVGYYVGGVLSDKYPSPKYFYGLTALAALFIAIIPFVAGPILTWSQLTFAGGSPLGVFYGSLVAILLLFSIPTILFGTISPYAIRLSIEQVGSAGRTAGKLYAISTAGSIVGTFLPVLVLLPDIGTNLTFLFFAVVLFLITVIGLLITK